VLPTHCRFLKAAGMTENPSQIEFYHDITQWKTHKGIGIGKSTQTKFSNSQTSTTTITTTSS